MKRFLVFLAILGTFLGVSFLYMTIARADNEAPMTEAHIARIRNNCIDAQATLNRLHAGDALQRVNQGQLYESISTKLMAPFNSRVALAHLDGVALVSLTTTYDQELSTFRTDYQQYEEGMSNLLEMNCTNQPVAFYDAVADVRAKRQTVHDDITALQKTVQDYQNAFETFAKHFEGNK